ncbi:hypothetical protein QA645_26820 [Bradyrhizobium sp. CIAT3101]|uniref:hypothetical protein n=1 Tax=Bradyrhizobium sp. CIAT3101 TaxID=439387 RepID=UPI0024B16474|nr:hypothetical protein [Bradyrhizobium sp. CIAT3101]WFU78149.1 hypothetical protein QA645_26820 [Bradyrhizobium sp. CIAT3101]
MNAVLRCQTLQNGFPPRMTANENELSGFGARATPSHIQYNGYFSAMAREPDHWPRSTSILLDESEELKHFTIHINSRILYLQAQRK